MIRLLKRLLAMRKPRPKLSPLDEVPEIIRLRRAVQRLDVAAARTKASARRELQKLTRLQRATSR
jgi:hypothetical protein